MADKIPFRADFVIVIPPDFLAEMGIEVTDFTAINASTLKPKKSRPSLRKVQEMIFSALLQGYEVTTDISKDGQDFSVIKLIPRSEIERVGKEWQVIKRGES